MWQYVEADFQRDYGIDLAQELPKMSWRKFWVLLAGLNPYGAVASHYDEALKEQRAQEISDNPDAAQQNANAFWRNVARI